MADGQTWLRASDANKSFRLVWCLKLKLWGWRKSADASLSGPRKERASLVRGGGLKRYHKWSTLSLVTLKGTNSESVWITSWAQIWSKCVQRRWKAWKWSCEENAELWEGMERTVSVWSQPLEGRHLHAAFTDTTILIVVHDYCFLLGEKIIEQKTTSVLQLKLVNN